MASFVGTYWNTFYSGDYRYFFSTLGQGDWTIYIGDEFDGNTVVVGSAADEWIFGGAGDDIIVGIDGRDVLGSGGGDGDDTVETSEGEDALHGGSGIDTLHLIAKDGAGWYLNLMSEMAYQLFGHFLPPDAEVVAFENVQGSTADDHIQGNHDDNILEDSATLGRDDDDVIFGMGGNDTIYIGGGSDDVDGGTGDDLIIARGWNMDDHEITGGQNADTFQFDLDVRQTGKAATITDFNWLEGDKIAVDSSFVLDKSGGQDTRLIGQASVWTTDDRAAGSKLHFDFNGDRLSDAWVDIIADTNDYFVLMEDTVLV